MKIPWRGHENDFMAHELSKIDGHDLIWGHEMSMKKEDILFMTHENKRCLFHGSWNSHETGGIFFSWLVKVKVVYFMGHEISLKLEDIFFMTCESKSCLFHGPWIFHENDGEGAHTMKLCHKTHAPCFSWFLKNQC